MRVQQVGLLAVLGVALSWECASSALAQDVDPPLPSTAVYPRWDNKTTNRTPRLVWTPGTDPSGVTYDLAVGTTRELTNPLVSVTGLTDPRYALTQQLDAERRYYWRVISVDGAGNSVVSFVDDFYLWPKPEVRYDIEVARDAAFNELHARNVGLLPNTYTLTWPERVTPNLNYFWRVTARDAAGNTTDATTMFGFTSIAPDTEPPQLPVLLFPASLATVSNPTPGFEWTDSVDPNGVSYTFEIDDDPAFGSSLVKAGLTESKVALDPAEALDRAVVYYWRVHVTDTLGNTAVSGASTFTLRGKPVTYRLEVAEDSNFDLIHVLTTGMTATTRTLTTAQRVRPGTTYYWRIIASDPAANTQTTPTFSFVSTAPDGDPPTLPVLLFPRSRSLVSNPTVSFEWSAASDPNGVIYDFELDDDPTFASPLTHAGLTEPRTALSPAESLARGIRYYWRVRVTDSVGNTDVTGADDFDLRAKDVQYRLEIADDQAFTQIHALRSGLDSELVTLTTAERVAPGETYWWRVRATDPGGNVRTSGVWSFDCTAPDTEPPTLPVLLYPRTRSVVSNQRLAFEWSEAADANGVTYGFELDEDPDFQSPVVYNGLTETRTALAANDAMIRGQRYYWRVRVTDTLGNTAVTGASDFDLRDKNVTYKLELAEDAGFTLIHGLRTGLSANEYTLRTAERITPNTTYYWRVTATDPAANEQVTPVFTFESTAADGDPPVLPVLEYPRSRSVISNQTVGFEWTDSADPSGVIYEFELDDDPAFGSPVRHAGLTDSTTSIGVAEALTRGVRYYWRVRVTDMLGNTDVTGADWFDLRAKGLTYRLDVAEDPAFTNVHTLKTGLSVTSVTLSTPERVTPGLTYYWRVTATDPAANTRSTGAYSFVSTAADGDPPLLPVLLFPRSRSTISNQTVSFEWTESSDPSGVTYAFEVDDDPAFSSPVSHAGLIAPRTALDPSESLTRGRRYYWRVRVTDSLGNTDVTGADWFDLRTKEISYRFEVAQDAAFTNLHALRSGLNTTNLTLSAAERVLPSVPYYWRVIALDPAANSVTSPTFEFSSNAPDGDPPALPVLLYPRSRSTISNQTVGFEWTDTADPNGVTYGFELDDDPAFASPVTKTGLTDSRAELLPSEALIRGRNYYWRVRVTDSLGNTDVTGADTFYLREKALTYKLEVSEDQTFTILHALKSGLDGTQATLTTAERVHPGTTYYWRVTATDPAANTWSTLPYDFVSTAADGDPPTLPVLLYPPMNSVITNPTVGFQWTEAADPAGVTYEFEVDDDPTFTTPVRRTGLTEPFASLTPVEALARGREYYWRVRVTDSLGNTAVSGANEFRVRDKGVAYRLEVAEDPTFTQLHVLRSGLDVTTLTLTTGERVLPGTTYHWRVTALDPASNGQMSPTYTFVSTAADGDPPVLPVLLYPRSRSTISNQIVSFDWTESADPNGVTYDFELDDDPAFGSPRTINGLSDSRTLLPTPLLRDTRYYWRVRVTDGLGNTDVTGADYFDLRDKAVSYRLEVAEDPSFSQLHVLRSGLPATSATLTHAERVIPGTEYHWRVTALDPASNRFVSPVYRFESIATDQEPPTLPTLLYPATRARVANQLISFDWSNSADPSGVTYDFELDDDPAFGSPIRRTLLTDSGTSLRASETLARGVRYYWRVAAVDNLGNRAWTAPSDFEVLSKDVAYRLRIASDWSFTNQHLLQADLTGSQYTLTPAQQVQPNQGYAWRIEALDPAENTRFSDIFEFNAPAFQSITGADVTPFGQPERATFDFTANRSVDWTITLYRYVNGTCAGLIYQSQLFGVTRTDGVWPGLSPGGSYCWSAIASWPNDSEEALGTITVPVGPRFEAGPDSQNDRLDVVVSAQTNLVVDADLRFAQGACPDGGSYVEFDGDDVITVPWADISRSAFTVEAWVRPDLPGQSAPLLSAAAGNVQMRLAGGRLEAQILTADGPRTLLSTPEVTVGAWSHVATVYNNGYLSVYIGGITAGGIPHTGDIVQLRQQVAIGGAGFVGAIASASMHDSAFPSSRLLANADAGAAGELPIYGGALAAYHFGEAQGVQQIYDRSGNHAAGVLGADHFVDGTDPSRGPTLSVPLSMGNGTTPSRQLSGPPGTDLTGGPSYCYVVQATSGAATIRSSPMGTFTRTEDVSPPTVTIDELNIVAECDGNSQRTLTIDPPTVADDFDLTPVVAAHLGTPTGSVVSFPHDFPLGYTSLHWSARDDSGNTGWSGGAQSVGVLDTVPPEATPGAEVRIEATNPTGTPFSPTLVSTFDVCDDSPSVTVSPASPYRLGRTLLAFTVTDESGNSLDVTRDLVVIDTTAPVFDPPLETITAGHPGAGCLSFTPPTPLVRDNGYTVDDVSISWQRTSGSGMPNCWDVGDHVVEWTLSDPEGNTRIGLQTVEVGLGNLVITVERLEVAGVTNPQPGSYYGGPVSIVFSVAGGNGPYDATVSPAPAMVSRSGQTFTARFEAPGAYPSLFISARDEGGNGPNVGSLTTEGFGIDIVAPTIVAPIIDATGVDIMDTSTYPPLYVGESVRLDKILALDAAAELTALGAAVMLDGVDDTVTIAHDPAMYATDMFSVEAWVRPSSAECPILSKSRAGGDRSLELRAMDEGEAQLHIGGADVQLRGGTIDNARWNHMAVTYDGRVTRLYVNGDPADSAAASGALEVGFDSLHLGARFTDGVMDLSVSPCEGEIASVAFWHHAYGAHDIAAHYRGGVGRAFGPAAGLVALYRFDESGQDVLDGSGSGYHGNLGRTMAPASDDPVRSALEHPRDGTASGLVGLEVVVQVAGGARQSQVIDLSAIPDGSPLLQGARLLGGALCSAPVGGPCLVDEALLTADGLARWAVTFTEAYHVQITATDAAGNETTTVVPLRTSTFINQLTEAMAEVDAMILVYPAEQALEDARLSLEVAHSYATMARPYLDGAYLRADQAVEALYEAEDVGVDVGWTPERLARSIWGEIGKQVRLLQVRATVDEAAIAADGVAYVDDAYFELYRGEYDDAISLSRAGRDVTMLLDPSLTDIRGALDVARARWDERLGDFGIQSITSEALRQDIARVSRVLAMMTEIRDALASTLYPEVMEALGNGFTSQRQLLSEIANVIDKSSSSNPQEEGDLVAVTDPSVQDACVDLLTNLRLDDRQFTLCYLRVNDLARFMDSVSEPLVPTGRWRTGLGLALFNMLELSLYLSPTGLPWVTAEEDTSAMNPPPLVLPDDEAALVSGAVPISDVDYPDDLLSTTYASYHDARRLLESGDTDGAWSIFVDARCLLLDVYNRYYSDLRVFTNVADPKEPPIDPVTVDCP